MLCPFCMLEYTLEAPCFCHAAVHVSDAVSAAEPATLDLVSPAGEFNFAALSVFDLASAAPYLGA